MASERPRADKTAAAGRPTQSAAERAPEGEAPATPDPATFSADYLRDHARALLNASPHLVAGALATERRKTFTLEGAAEVVKRYAGREIKPDTGAGS